MYYRSVNRGVVFTKPGKYAIGLVIVLGFIATGSGYNGFYLSLSMGLALLVISGLLSEKVMKHYELQALSSVVAEPAAPFTVTMRAVNRSPSFVIYGVENLVLSGRPHYGWRLRLPSESMKGTVLVLSPQKEAVIPALCTGLKRGLYQEFFVVQRTLYPFGLLAKFKLSKVSGEVAVVPSKDDAFASMLRRELQRHAEGSLREQEFHSHRHYLHRDPIRHVDWKKSAGLETTQWVLKQYESLSENIGIVIEANWGLCQQECGEEVYESHLSRLRTACEVIRETQRRLVLSLGGKMSFGAEASVKRLAALPAYHHRSQPFESEETAVPAGTYLRFSLTPGSHELKWDAEPIRISPS